MPTYSLIEHSDNQSDTSGNLWKFKRDKQNINTENFDNVAIVNSISFKYKLSILGEATTPAGNNGILKNAKIFVPLKHLKTRSLKRQVFKRFVTLDTCVTILSKTG